MNINVNRNETDFIYDPSMHSYPSGLWNTPVTTALTGTPSISSAKLAINTAGCATAGSYKADGLDVSFSLTIPAAPTSGDARFFGLKSLNLGNVSLIGFDITGAVLSAKVYDDAGNLLSVYDANGAPLASNAITWVAGWTNTQTTFRITKSNGRIYFYIGGTLKAKTDVSTEVGTTALPITITNANADNMLLHYMIVKHGSVS